MVTFKLTPNALKKNKPIFFLIRVRTTEVTVDLDLHDSATSTITFDLWVFEI